MSFCKSLSENREVYSGQFNNISKLLTDMTNKNQTIWRKKSWN